MPRIYEIPYSYILNYFPILFIYFYFNLILLPLSFLIQRKQPLLFWVIWIRSLLFFTNNICIWKPLRWTWTMLSMAMVNFNFLSLLRQVGVLCPREFSNFMPAFWRVRSITNPWGCKSVSNLLICVWRYICFLVKLFLLNPVKITFTPFHQLKTSYWIIRYACIARFYFPVWIPGFYAKSWSLYANVSVILSKWTSLYSQFIIWVCTFERRPIQPSGCVCVCVCVCVCMYVLRMRSALYKTRGRDWF